MAALPVLLLAAAGPASWQPWAVAAAAALTITAVLIPTDPEETVSLLSGVAVIGVGVAVDVGGVAMLTGGHTLFGVAMIVVGMAVAVGGVVHLHRGDTGDRVRAWWDRVTSDPAQLPGTTGPEPGESAGPVPDSTMAAEPGRPGQGRPPG